MDTFSAYGVNVHLLCSSNRVWLSYELTPASVTDVTTARRPFGDLAYRGGPLGDDLAGRGTALATERAHRYPAARQQVGVRSAALERTSG